MRDAASQERWNLSVGYRLEILNAMTRTGTRMITQRRPLKEDLNVLIDAASQWVRTLDEAAAVDAPDGWGEFDGPAKT